MMEKTILVSGACVFKRTTGGVRWFIVKQGEEGGWEIPKALVRRGESSVRAGIRMMAEQGGMRVKVLEEVGRGGGATKYKGKVLPQRYLYYLMIYKDGGEVIGFNEYDWLEYGRASRKLSSKREKAMLKAAGRLLKQLLKEGRKLLNSSDMEVE